MDPKIFITYSSKDEKVSRTICTALENRGLACWISSRDVKPGQNFQEQIVKAIRAAKIMVLVFTANANNSSEIKKELALASQNNLVVIPVRIEDVTPNEAFAYEFATRQWIDLFGNWESSITRLVELIAASIDDPSLTGDAAAPSFGKTRPASFIRRPGPRWAMICGVATAVILAAAIAYVVATLPRQSAPVAVATTNASPPPLSQTPPSAPVAVIAPSLSAAPAPQQTQPLPSVQVASSVPSEPVAQSQQTQPPAPSTPPTPSQPSAPVVSTAPAPAPMSSRAPAVTQPSPNEAERAWAVTKDTTSPAVLQAYIKQFGATVYGNMARARLSELQAAAPKPPGKLAVASPAGSAPVQNKSSPSPPTINECETLVSTICGMWTFAGNNYIAQWQNGARAQLYVERFDDGGIVITRSDTSGISAGMTARYTGQPKGRGVIGEVIWIENGFSKKGTWNANW